ncbi:MAG TPA: RtcB family protein [Bacteroidetes bacterium]|nr:RtcB family protein [Bacteroidota bacterium]
MAKLKIRGKDLRKIGYPQGPAIGVAINEAQRHFKKEKKQKVLDMLQHVLQNRELYEGHVQFGKVAEALKPKEKSTRQEVPLNELPLPFKSYGLPNIEEGALLQIDAAVRLPVAVKAALMPDAHQGYGLPIGGVLATKNAVIPYGVGVDIGCRMCLTMYDLKPSFLEKNRSKLKDILFENTAFGLDEQKTRADDPVLEKSAFKEIGMVKALKDKAWKQLGSSGSGNHFVEFGIVHISDGNNEFGMARGEYLALLSHSGSRGLGAKIANHYTKLAMEKCPLPKMAKYLSWLDLDSEEGQEYWLAMNLAGDYASACHHNIHKRIGKALGEQYIAMVENHHNFAWKEELEDGTPIIVHRKGATPAGKGVLGVIPGSMVHPGFIVRGKGNPLAINSASHGAGRVMSRTKAKNSTTRHALKKLLKEHQVDLIGGGLDESPIAYKDINQVMGFQKDLVEIVGTFTPKIVRMAEDKRK